MARPTLDPYIDSILYGTNHWGLDTLRYYFDNSYDSWTLGAKQAFRAALDSWAAVADLTFQETYLAGAADLIESYVNNADMSAEIGPGVLGAHEVPWSSNHSVWLQGWFNWQAFNWPGPNGYSAGSLEPGGLAMSVFVHELGHALGLAHPHDNDGETVRMPGVSAYDDLGTYELNQGVFTVMSYNDGWVVQNPWGKGVNDRGYNAGPGALDIAAIQFLYGANTSNKGGNTVYKLGGDMGWGAIWDTGGTDKIAYSGNANAVINLNAAALDEGPNAGGYLSYLKGSNNFGGYTIAGDFTDVLADQGDETGVIIENATGGGGDDRITGNAVANVLIGNGGNDRISGGKGNDKIKGGSGNDNLSGSLDDDDLRGSGGKDRLDGGAGEDLVLGGNGDDVLIGRSGADRLNGGAGADILRGGGGADRFVFREGYDADEVRDFENDVDRLALDDNLWEVVMDAAAVVDAFATDLGDDVEFDFGDGNRLLVIGIANLDDLKNDILIV
ncbi:MAG: matrixin family metalloprotease [Paracoccaceae bacterium]